MYDTERLSTSNRRINTCDNKQQLCSVGSHRAILSSFTCCLRGHDFTSVNETTAGFCKSSACPLMLLVNIASRCLKPLLQKIKLRRGSLSFNPISYFVTNIIASAGQHPAAAPVKVTGCYSHHRGSRVCLFVGWFVSRNT